jgi:hypothetical protein
MHVLSIGSVPVDHVYEGDRFVRPGETGAGTRYRVFAFDSVPLPSAS